MKCVVITFKLRNEKIPSTIERLVACLYLQAIKICPKISLGWRKCPLNELLKGGTSDLGPFYFFFFVKCAVYLLSEMVPTSKEKKRATLTSYGGGRNFGPSQPLDLPLDGGENQEINPPL